MEINKKDDYQGISNFLEIDDFSELFFEDEAMGKKPLREEDCFYRRLDEY